VIYRVLADLTVLLHFGFILFVLFGGLLVVRRKAVAWVHLPVLAWGVAVQFAGWDCPLTVLEKWLRIQAGLQGYSGGFTVHWILNPLFHPGTIGPAGRALFAFVPIFANVVFYREALHVASGEPRRPHRWRGLRVGDQAPRDPR
jgi:hypothetical protein